MEARTGGAQEGRHDVDVLRCEEAEGGVLLLLSPMAMSSGSRRRPKHLGTEGRAREGGCDGWLGTKNKVKVAAGFGGDLDWEELVNREGSELCSGWFGADPDGRSGWRRSDGTGGGFLGFSKLGMGWTIYIAGDFWIGAKPSVRS